MRRLLQILKLSRFHCSCWNVWCLNARLIKTIAGISIITFHVIVNYGILSSHSSGDLKPLRQRRSMIYFRNASSNISDIHWAIIAECLVPNRKAGGIAPFPSLSTFCSADRLIPQWAKKKHAGYFYACVPETVPEFGTHLKMARHGTR